ncbi:hypothetical protein QMA02_30870 [Bacillus wiedmannii]|uniref:hypothetical protein n=1 Tax=Bacillus wiedmannii TaxID=1890302 RepID=UPI0024AD7CC1|nr:hypothetical protein [Bacillus wiedmannii]MDI6680151.1 hypothetical protein [Bacillus wiedmannii]
MRHTRNRQMTKIGEENFMSMKNIKISTIRKPNGKFPNRLDPTFKWNREIGIVTWSFWIGNIETTRCAVLKFPEHVKY